VTSLPIVSGEAVVRALGRNGFVMVSQRGSHAKLRAASGRTVIVPMHREIRQGTLRSILRQAALSAEQFVVLLGS
jgi:predicted RNA binding protein YcfA (HicA-like mRNA interferase family)